MGDLQGKLCMYLRAQRLSRVGACSGIMDCLSGIEEATVVVNLRDSQWLLDRVVKKLLVDGGYWNVSLERAVSL